MVLECVGSLCLIRRHASGNDVALGLPASLILRVEVSSLLVERVNRLLLLIPITH